MLSCLLQATNPPFFFISSWLEILYALAALLFIFALYGLQSQDTANLGNLCGVVGMMIAVIGTYVQANYFDVEGDVGWWAVPIAVFVGGSLGALLALRVSMVRMPQMVGLLNSFGGAAAAVESVGIIVYVRPEQDLTIEESRLQMAWALVGVFVGTITFTGSLIACRKVEVGLDYPKWVRMPQLINLLLLSGVIALMVLAGLSSYCCVENPAALLLPNVLGVNSMIFVGPLLAVSALYGMALVLPIGGADMPVVIAVLNALSGVSLTVTGFASRNTLMIVTGALVAASGCILSYIMCRAMNRSLANVLIGGFGTSKASEKPALDGELPPVHSVDPGEVADLLLAAKSVLIVPGYGMAVARAQSAVSELVSFLRQRDKRVAFGIHPVAGRLPGHMNVLLAEARVPYELVHTMDEVNVGIAEQDVVLVIGANDIVNPSAELDPTCAIAGMPVIRVWQAKSVVVFKRSLGRGYAAIDNPLFFYPVTSMYFGDAKKMVDELLLSLRAKSVVVPPTHTASLSTTTARTGGVVAPVQEVVEFGEAFCVIGVLRETKPLERRVSCVPKTAFKLRQMGFRVLVEQGAGHSSHFNDSDYIGCGAEVLPSAQAVIGACRVVMKVAAPSPEEARLLLPEQVLVSYIWPASNTELLQQLADLGITTLAMDCVPRITTAQSLDSLSSMALLGGYRAVIEAAWVFEHVFMNQMTAAGSYPPAIVLVIGGGVAGLAALGLALGLGAVTRCFDTRSVVKEQVESMGAEFLEVHLAEEGESAGGYSREMSPAFIEAEMALFAQQAAEVDIIITTASIPGRAAPLLLTQAHVELMKPGSVIVDLAAESGGNCELTVRDQMVVHNNVSILGYTDFPSRMARQASEMYSTNLVHLMALLGGGQDFGVDPDVGIVRSMLVTHRGAVTWPPPRAPPPPAAPPADPRATMGALATPVIVDQSLSPWMLFVSALLILAVFILIAIFFPASFNAQWIVFVLAVVIGYTSVWNVAPALHTPLMSVTNAISGVIVIGGIILATGDWRTATFWLGLVGVAIASVNVAGGFLVTHRMLRMFAAGSDERSDASLAWELVRFPRPRPRPRKGWLAV